MNLATGSTMLGPDRVRRDVEACPRCGDSHQYIVFERMPRPVTLRPTEDPDLDYVYEWAGECPKLGQPILGRKLNEF